MTDKVSLQGTDIIISYREGSQDRKDNIYTNLKYLNHTFKDYRVLLMEADNMPKFDWSLLGDSKIEHHFFYDSDAFPKAFLYNKGVKFSSSAVVALLDADCIVNPETFAWCVADLLTHDTSGAWSVFDQWIDVFGTLKSQFMAQPDFSVLAPFHKDNPSESAVTWVGTHPGGVVIMRQSEYVRIGGLDQNMRGWGGEDVEFSTRAHRLGVNWQTKSGVMYHLFHDTFNRYEENKNEPDAVRNGALIGEMCAMPLDALQEMVLNMRRAYFGEAYV